MGKSCNTPDVIMNNFTPSNAYLATLQRKYEHDSESLDEYITNRKRQAEILYMFYMEKNKDVFSKLLFLADTDRYRVLQLIGAMQAGKTDAMLAIHHYDIVCKEYFTVHVVPDSGDVPQIELSLESYNKQWMKYAVQYATVKKWPVGDVVYPLTMVRAEQLKLDNESNVVNTRVIKKVMRISKKQSSIVVSLAHPDQLYRISKLIWDRKHSRCDQTRNYNVIFDESHISMFPQESSKFLCSVEDPDDVKNWPVKLKLCESVNDTLPRYASRIIGTSATPARNLFEDRFPVNGIIYIEPKENYRSVLNMHYHLIEEMDIKTGLDQDKELHRILGNLSRRSRFCKSDINTIRDHPIFLLIQNSPHTLVHQKIEDYIWNTHTNDFTTILHNDKGLVVRFPDNLKQRILNDCHNKVEIKNGSKVYKFEMTELGRVFFKTNTPLHCVLQMLADFEDDLVDRIILISGNKVKQGRRVNSTDYRLALTHEFIRDESPMDTGLQKLRIVGYRPDGRQPVVYCTERFHNDAINSYKLTKEMTESLGSELNRGHVNANIVLARMTVNQGKCPTMPLCKAGMPMKVVSNHHTDDFEGNATGYTEDRERTETSNSKKRRNERKERREQIIEPVVNPPITITCIEGLEKVKNIWLNKKGKQLHILIKAFVDSGGDSLSSAYLSDIGVHAYNFTRWEIEHNRYKIMEKTEDGRKYNIRSDIIECLGLDIR